jgi:hypothetical protein
MRGSLVCQDRFSSELDIVQNCEYKIANLSAEAQKIVRTFTLAFRKMYKVELRSCKTAGFSFSKLEAAPFIRSYLR